MSREITDIQLIKQVLEGNQVSFEKLYKRHNRLYMSICMRYFSCRSDAEDALQDAMIKIYRHLSSFDLDKASFITWSKKVVINACIEKLRKPTLINYFSSLFEFGKRIEESSEAIENLNLQDLTKLIQGLPKGYRTVFNMYVIDGYKHNEISEILKISISTSKTQLMKAKKILQTKISNEDLVFDQIYA